MNEYYVKIKGEQSGPYPESIIQSKVLSGEVSSDDLCWTEGMEAWQPIHSVHLLAPSSAAYTPEPLTAPSEPQTSAAEHRYGDYRQVPWYRKSSINSIFILLSFISCGLIPGILAVCIIVLTGDVYSNNRDDHGNLKKWGPANKVAAFILLLINIGAVVYGFLQ